MNNCICQAERKIDGRHFSCVMLVLSKRIYDARVDECRCYIQKSVRPVPLEVQTAGTLLIFRRSHNYFQRCLQARKTGTRPTIMLERIRRHPEGEEVQLLHLYGVVLLAYKIKGTTRR